MHVMVKLGIDMDKLLQDMHDDNISVIVRRQATTVTRAKHEIKAGLDFTLILW